jgi:hypothetical protein
MKNSRQHKKINNYVSPSTRRRKPFPQAGSRVECAHFTLEISFHRFTEGEIVVAGMAEFASGN